MISLFIYFYILLITAHTQYIGFSEERLFFDFKTKNSHGWTGIDEGWKWTTNNIEKSMNLKNVPITQDSHDVLVLDTSKNTYATLTSSSILMSTKSAVSCLYFSYYVRVTNSPYYGLRLNSITNNGSYNKKQQLWAMSSEDYDIWQVAEVEIDRREEIQIQFEANQTKIDLIALNGFFLRDGSCPDLPNIDCNFESEQFCYWISTNSANGDSFYRTKSGSQNYFSIKREDHTTDSLFGHTAIFANSIKNQTQLISPIVEPTYHKCLKFAFMSNSKNISLDVRSRHSFDSIIDSWKILWLPSKEYFINEWHLIQIPINLNIAQQFMINVTKYNNIHAENAIQIDDIQLTPYCSSDITCKFSNGFCGWHSLKSDQLRWKIGTGRLTNLKQNQFLAPTTVSALYTDFSTINRHSEMRILSPWVDNFNFKKCAKMDFLVSEFDHDSSFSLNIIDQNGIRTKLWSFDSNIYQLKMIYLSERIFISEMFQQYHLELVAKSSNPLTRISVMRFELIDSSPDNCQSLKHQSPKPVTVTTTPTQLKKSKIDPILVRLVNSQLKNVQNEVKNILNIIVNHKQDILYELVDNLEIDVLKALQASTL